MESTYVIMCNQAHIENNEYEATTESITTLFRELKQINAVVSGMTSNEIKSVVKLILSNRRIISESKYYYNKRLLFQIKSLQEAYISLVNGNESLKLRTYIDETKVVIKFLIECGNKIDF